MGQHVLPKLQHQNRVAYHVISIRREGPENVLKSDNPHRVLQCRPAQYTSQLSSFEWSSQGDELGGTRGIHEGQKCIEGFGGKALSKEATWKT